jgi:hypothetical protein
MGDATVGPAKRQPVTPDRSAPHASGLQALQRQAGNRAATGVFQHRQVAQRAPAAAPVPITAAQHNTLSEARERLFTLQEGLDRTLVNALKFVGEYRGKATWMVGQYSRLHGDHAAVVAEMKAAALNTQLFANLAYGAGLSIALGYLGNAGVAAKLISEAVNFWGVGVVAGDVLGTFAAPSIPIPDVVAGQEPVFRQLGPLQKLDELNTTLAALAVNGNGALNGLIRDLTHVLEPTAHHVGPAPAPLGTLLERVSKIEAVGAAEAELRSQIQSLWEKFWTAPPPPTDLQTQQDIWIVWMANQDDPSDSTMYHPFRSPTLIARLRALELVGDKSAGGALGVPSAEVRRLVTGADDDTVEIFGPDLMWAAAKDQAQRVGQEWARRLLL